MASTSKQSDEASTSDSSPHEQLFQTVAAKGCECTGRDYELVKEFGSASLGTLNWGRVPFEFRLERIGVTDENHKDLILNVNCNNQAHDPHWRCSFTVTVECIIAQLNIFETAEHSMTANRTNNSMVIPIMRMTDGADAAKSAHFNIKIQMDSWAGNFPYVVQSFSEKTDLTDATLIVEGKHLYVSRAILALHSSFFNTLFYDHKFPDAAKKEFTLQDISYDDMETFLTLIYPNVANEQYRCISTVESIESMLALAERFGCDSLTRLMEKYLMGEMKVQIDGFTLARRLLISDRFRLSSPCSLLMEKLRCESDLQRLGDSEEYSELSKDLKAAILDMRMHRRSMDDSPASPDERLALEDDDAPLPIRFRASSQAIPRRRLPPPTITADTFFADVNRLSRVLPSLPISSRMIDQLESAVETLQGLSREEFGQIPNHRRFWIHTYGILPMLNASNHASLHHPAATFLTHVTRIREEYLQGASGSSARKRMRIRDFVLQRQSP
ncbi:hypothetical protein PMAYCL1PPCAC_01990 [Pristionchus mayeri]|uniref:BTB domain-containing protein n=1 Tax=Pristionchus mayeri TaxID=1317129 RepID=A0AAN4Z5V4_9BILA|nr:hypothetical protein PMAYCL1PPCAC_01990 [Pristionchus mayeri]